MCPAACILTGAGSRWGVFTVTAVAAMGVSLLTVSVQAVRAATRNPVESLRSA